MASRLVCGTAILKMPVRAEMVTGTVVFTHCLAAAIAASARTGSTRALNMVREECRQQGGNTTDTKAWTQTALYEIGYAGTHAIQLSSGGGFSDRIAMCLTHQITRCLETSW